MIYKIRHLTAYSYDRTVNSARLVLRVTPRDEPGQRTMTHQLNILPVPMSVDTERDFYGNTVNVVTIDTEHRELTIEAISTVELTHQAALPLAGEPWEEVSNAALVSRDLTGSAPAHFMFASPRIQLAPDVTQYARESFKPDRGILEASRDLIKRIRTDFDYDPETTDINTPLTQAFAQRQGVCQDFAASACRRPMSAATSVPSRRRARSGSKAPTPRTPGSRSGAARRMAGWASTPPTPSMSATTTLPWRSAAICPMFRRSTAYSSAPAAPSSKSRSMSFRSPRRRRRRNRAPPKLDWLVA